MLGPQTLRILSRVKKSDFAAGFSKVSNFQSSALLPTKSDSRALKSCSPETETQTTNGVQLRIRPLRNVPYQYAIFVLGLAHRKSDTRLADLPHLVVHGVLLDEFGTMTFESITRRLSFTTSPALPTAFELP